MHALCLAEDTVLCNQGSTPQPLSAGASPGPEKDLQPLCPLSPSLPPTTISMKLLSHPA